MSRIRFLALLLGLCAGAPAGQAALAVVPAYFDVKPGSHPHDVAATPLADGPVYFTAQGTGKLGILDPKTGRVEEIALGPGSAPHGVIVGPDGAAWITDGGHNAILRYDPQSRAVRRWPLPAEAPDANLNTLVFDTQGRLWFTGQNGYYGRLLPASGAIKVWKAPRGRGPLRHRQHTGTAPSTTLRWPAATSRGSIRRAAQRRSSNRRPAARARAASGRMRRASCGSATGTPASSARYDPATHSWREWQLPGDAHAYALWVDDQDKVWLSEWNSNAIIRFDPRSERFDSFPSDRDNAAVRQILGRPGEVWGAESGNDRLFRLNARF